jgi:hypothetical protein
MSLAVDRCLTTATRLPEGTTTEESGLNIVVIFTTVDATVSALNRAATLAESLGARITLVSPQVVPYPLPLTSPPVLLDFQERRLREIAAESRVDVRVQLYLCRDELETLKRVLKPKSIVVIGGRRRWWPTREQRLAHKLRSDHEVVFAEAGEFPLEGRISLPKL